jgi:hypothetical protein
VIAKLALARIQAQAITIDVDFVCLLDIHNRKQFQADGHMLFSLYKPNPKPEELDILRPWEGEDVYALRLMYKGQQVHRVMSDSLQDATRLMAEGLRNVTFANFSAAFQQQFDRVQFESMHRERAEFAEWIASTFAAEIKAGRHAQFRTPFEVAKHYISEGRK